MPMALPLLLFFGLIWIGFTLSGVVSNFTMLRTATPTDAVVVERQLAGMESFPELRLTETLLEVPSVITDDGSPLAVPLPSGTRSLAVGARVSVYVDNQTVVATDTVRSNIWSSGAMSLGGLLIFFVAGKSRRALRADRERLAILRNAPRIPARSSRISSEWRIKRGSRRTRWWVHAEFVHEGRLYEAVSDSFDREPVLPDQPVIVALHPKDPRLSMVAAESLAAQKR
jgi:hypothetical protein